MTALLATQPRIAPKPSDASPSHGGAREASRRRGQARGALPEEIAFLAAHGVSAPVLVESSALSRRLGVCPVAALLSTGRVSDLLYYALLARRLGLPFVASPSFLGDISNPTPPAGAPIVRLPDGDRYLIAPEGENLRALLALRTEGRIPRARLVITTPRRLASTIRAAGARAIARAACEDLSLYDASLSAATPPGPFMRGALAAAALLGGCAGVAGGALWVALCGALGVVAACVVAQRLMATFASLKPVFRQAPALSDARLPTYTIIAPLYREAGVVARLVRAIDALDYPATKLEVKFVVEADDHDTRAAIEMLALAHRYETIIAPPGAPRTKPRAMNVALPTARGSLIVVFDAEDSPEPDQLRRAAERFAVSDARLGCVQAKLAIDNTGDSWLAAGIMAQLPQEIQ